MSEHKEIHVRLQQEGEYGFHVRFEGLEGIELHTDESAPLGTGAGPDPARLLVAATANCLSASLLFALRKFRNTPAPIQAEAVARMHRNEAGRWRIPKISVRLVLGDDATGYEHLERILGQFEAFCIVTQSVREGIAVEVVVEDAGGRVLNN